LPPDPPEVAAFDDRWRPTRTDRERIVVLGEEMRASIRLQVETKNQLLDAFDEHASTDREAHAHLADGLLAMAESVRGLTTEVRTNEGKRQREAADQAERDGRILRELADGRRQDSIHDIVLGDLTKKQTTTEAAMAGLRRAATWSNAWKGLGLAALTTIDKWAPWLGQAVAWLWTHARG
jgi:hypothetical protein